MKSVSILIALFPFLLLGQQEEDNLAKTSLGAAADKLAAGNYEEALTDYLSLHSKDPQNMKINYDIAVCYLNFNGNKTKALPYLEKIVHDPLHDPNAEYLLGRAYQFSLKFDEAEKYFSKFVTRGKGKEDLLKDAANQIQYCINARERVKFPLNVKFENLGNAVNSEFADYYAFIPVDESFIIFNSKRPVETVEKKDNGEYPNVIMISEVRDGKFQEAKKLDLLFPKELKEWEVIGLSANGQALLVYASDGKNPGNIFIAEKDAQGKFNYLNRLDKHINSNAEEIAASINAEGTVIYFTSDRTGGIGGTDIYISRKTPKGVWGEAQNAGKEINTPQNEDFPNISPDGKSLYFSSTGHTSMGGYDIFKASWNEQTNAWENPKNIGFPVNTPMDDYNFRISKNSRYGYISAIRDEGLGDFDNYRIIFNDVEPELTVMYGQILAEDGSQINYPDVFISVTSDKSGELMGNYVPNSNTGKYVVILPPGHYTLTVELFNFKLLTQKLEILDKSSFQAEKEFNLKLQIQK